MGSVQNTVTNSPADSCTTAAALQVVAGPAGAAGRGRRLAPPGPRAVAAAGRRRWRPGQEYYRRRRGGSRGAAQPPEVELGGLQQAQAQWTSEQRDQPSRYHHIMIC